MTTHRKISLLYAEDDAQTREMLLKLLNHKFPELTVYSAADGAQGVALFKEHRPDLILADMTMPVLDGFEMTREIRRIAPDVYVIALTAHNDAEWQAKSKELNFNATLSKPVEFKKLIEAVGATITLLQEEGPR